MEFKERIEKELEKISLETGKDIKKLKKAFFRNYNKLPAGQREAVERGTLLGGMETTVLVSSVLIGGFPVLPAIFGTLLFGTTALVDAYQRLKEKIKEVL